MTLTNQQERYLARLRVAGLVSRKYGACSLRTKNAYRRAFFRSGTKALEIYNQILGQKELTLAGIPLLAPG